MDTLIVVENLVKKYGKFVLEVPRAEFGIGLNMVLGPNGSGKTTLLKIIAGVSKPKKGVVRYLIDGKELSWSEAREKMFLVGDFMSLPNHRVREILREFASSPRDVSRVVEVLELEEHLSKRYNELSMGFKKRVQLALAMLRDPKILLLDEPFANVDAFMVPKLARILTDLAKDRVIIVTSHIELDLDISRILMLDQGRVVYYGSARELTRFVYSIEIVRDGRRELVSLSDLAKALGASSAKIVRKPLIEVVKEASKHG